MTSGTIDTSYVSQLLEAAGSIINILMPMVVALTVLALMWGLFQYVRGGAEEKEKGKSIMIYGIIAIAVMVSVYGLVRILQNTFGIGSTQQVTIPSVTIPTLN